MAKAKRRRAAVPKGDRANRFVGKMSDFRVVGIYNEQTGQVEPIPPTLPGGADPEDNEARAAFVRKRAEQLELERQRRQS